MADKVTNKLVINLEFGMVRNGAVASRQISFDSNFGNAETVRNYVTSFCQNLLENYPKFIQPTNWRDSDAQEKEWTTTKITPTINTETILQMDDIGDGGSGGGSTDLLPRNMQVQYDNGTKTLTVTAEGDLTDIDIIALNSSDSRVSYSGDISGQTASGTFAEAIRQLYVMLPETEEYQAANYMGVYS